MKISELLQRIDYTVLQGDLSEEITGICHDNRMLQEGDAFICIAGARFDTHTMAKELTKKAALLVVEKPVELDADCKTAVVQVASTRDVVAALAAAFYGYPSEKMVCIGITGSKGKTTCTHMMADILRAAGYLLEPLVRMVRFFQQDVIMQCGDPINIAVHRVMRHQAMTAMN